MGDQTSIACISEFIYASDDDDAHLRQTEY